MVPPPTLATWCSAKAVDLEGFTPEKLVASGTGGNVAVFVMATYGEGDPTDNAVPFAKWLQDDATAAGKPLKGFRFTVFGLGNRQYERYNYMGKLTNEKLAALGAWRGGGAARKGAADASRALSSYVLAF